MNAALAFGDGNALHAMHAGLPAHNAKGAVAFDLEDRLLQPAEGALGIGYRLDAPSAALSEALIHAREVRREDGGLIAACPCADFDDCRPVIERVVRNQRRLDALFELGDRRFEACD